MSKKYRFAVVGCGFWANYQVPAWLELEGVELVALYNRTIAKADALAKQYHVPATYDNAESLLDNEKLDFIDIITDVETHAVFTRMAAERSIAVICQKPMAPDFNTAKQMLSVCSEAGVLFFIHENFRWQLPIREVKKALDGNLIGKPFKARLTFCSAFPVFDNQPALAELKHFIITDIGSHILDICRFLFGEAETLYCQTQTINPKIKGEDVANVFLKMKSGLHCYIEMSYASILEKESFPETLLLVEGETGSIELSHNHILKITNRKGTVARTVEPMQYDWADKDYAVVHSSIVDCNRNILEALQGRSSGETTGADNFETVKLVWAAYSSACTNTVIILDKFN
ncbi:MAG: Gfo/Idh/MocA family protein [Flavitalea sp.]